MLSKHYSPWCGIDRAVRHISWNWKRCINELEYGCNIIKVAQMLICCEYEAIKSYENFNPINIYDHISGCNTNRKGAFMSQISKGSIRILGKPTTIIIDLYTINNSNPNFTTLLNLISKVMNQYVRPFYRSLYTYRFWFQKCF